jgi:hypothetical protein
MEDKGYIWVLMQRYDRETTVEGVTRDILVIDKWSNRDDVCVRWVDRFELIECNELTKGIATGVVL